MKIPLLNPAHVLRCAQPGCDATVNADRKHLPNLTATTWRCHDHKRGS